MNVASPQSNPALSRALIGEVDYAAGKFAEKTEQGKSLDEIVAAKPTAATDEKWGSGFKSPKDFIGDVFQGA